MPVGMGQKEMSSGGSGRTDLPVLTAAVGAQGCLLSGCCVSHGCSQTWRMWLAAWHRAPSTTETSAGSRAKAARQPDKCGVLTSHRLKRNHADVFLLYIYSLLAADRPIHPEWEPQEASRGPSQPPANVSPLQTRLPPAPVLSSFCQQDGGSLEAVCSGQSVEGLGLNPLGFLCFPDCVSYTLLSQCPVAAITKDHKRGGCKQQDFIPSSGGQKSKISV